MRIFSNIRMLEYFLYPIVVGDMICQLKCPFGHDLAAISILISRPIFKICRQLIIIIIKILFMHHLFFFSFHFLSFVLAKNLSILPHLTFNHFFPFFFSGSTTSDNTRILYLDQGHMDIFLYLF